MKLIPIQETGDGRTGTLLATYSEILKKVGEPNVTELDDPDKVKASWGYKSDKKKIFIWCYKFYGNPENCEVWSIDGDKDLLKQIFGNDAVS